MPWIKISSKPLYIGPQNLALMEMGDTNDIIKQGGVGFFHGFDDKTAPGFTGCIVWVPGKDVTKWTPRQQHAYLRFVRQAKEVLYEMEKIRTPSLFPDPDVKIFYSEMVAYESALINALTYPVTSADIVAFDEADDSKNTKGLIHYKTNNDGKIVDFSFDSTVKDTEQISRVIKKVATIINGKIANSIIINGLEIYGNYFFDSPEEAAEFDTEFDDGNLTSGLFTYINTSSGRPLVFFENASTALLQVAPAQLEKMAKGTNEEATKQLYNRRASNIFNMLTRAYKAQARFNSFTAQDVTYSKSVGMSGMSLPSAHAYVKYVPQTDGSMIIRITADGPSFFMAMSDDNQWEAGVWEIHVDENWQLIADKAIHFSPLQDDDGEASYYTNYDAERGDEILDSGRSLNIDEAGGVRMSNWWDTRHYKGECHQLLMTILQATLPRVGDNDAQRVYTEHVINGLEDLKKGYRKTEAATEQEITRFLNSDLSVPATDEATESPSTEKAPASPASPPPGAPPSGDGTRTTFEDGEDGD